jgi:hypothetical protein
LSKPTPSETIGNSGQQSFKRDASIMTIKATTVPLAGLWRNHLAIFSARGDGFADAQ